ncbi:hypothetical protein BJ508DRAFT_216947 [Ascobolus immersus RN42]|uniref:DUF4419 domain-containing protein n=1 Tax=Ascobolus immersus RN42 TaxID=1160509 RepID=A0A3N4HKV3_ASCIM|nr:hypothetical protein BJ508DRAFT_216947 [Ascobolus immersus RN42]
MGRDNSPPLSKVGITRWSGLVQTCFDAYSNHHHLVLRPDDVWVAIISQFALFLSNKEHSEELRDWFTNSPDKQQIYVEVNSLSEAPDKFRAALAEKVVDKGLIPWIIPSFTTTTRTDKEVASYLLMGALKNYFEYGMGIACGLPSVTLLGTKKDYEDILSRLDYLDKFKHADLKAWAKLLRVVMKQAFIAAFDYDKAKDVRNTWGLIANRIFNGSGPTYISGWLTVFTFFGEKGTRVGSVGGKHGKLLGENFPVVDTKSIAPGYLEVPIKVDGLPRREGLTDPRDITVIAGSVGCATGRFEFADEEAEAAQVNFECAKEEDDTLVPVSGWWIVEKDKSKDVSRPGTEAYKEEERRKWEKRLAEMMGETEAEEEASDAEK